MNGANRLTWLVSLMIGALVLFSIALSLGRIYQVDEAQNLYMARVAVRGEATEFFTTAALHLIPLGWLTTSFPRSAEVFTAARLLFLIVFWCNVLLLARATGVRIRSAAGAWTTLGAATLAPLWDYGIEVRHDNLLLGGILSMWALGRPGAAHELRRFVGVGFLAALLQFVAAKALLYTTSVSLLTLTVASLSLRERTLRRIGAWALGLLLGLACVRLVYALVGLWDVQLASYRDFSRVQRVSWDDHLFTLERLVRECPVLLLATLVALGYLLRRMAAERTVVQQAGVAETLLLGAAAAAFIANPSPFPYNLLLVVPFAYLLVVRVLLRWLDSRPSPNRASAWIAGGLLLLHGLSFLVASARHLAWDNERQQTLMSWTEALTDPVRDRVYDASGLVVSRRATQRWWYLHSLNMPVYGTAQFPRLSEVFKLQPASVVLRSYRTDWLPPEDDLFIRAHYVALADDIWVLGTLSSADKHWECLHAGRYQLLLNGAPEVLLDGVQVRPGAHTVLAGAHELRVRGSGSAALVWLGPRLEALPSLPDQRHELLFINWY